MLTYKKDVNKWVGEIESISSIFLINIFEASGIVAKAMHLFDFDNYITIIIDSLKPIRI